MRFGSVCSGIEAASVAWEALGWQPQWFCEVAKFPSRVLTTRWPSVPNLGDFTSAKIEPGSIELLVGGTPCQSFSVAGLRGGMDDDRGNLALEFCRLAERARPRWVLWENVPGVLSSNRGRDFGAILGALAQLGYGWAYRVLDAQHFGVPQRRRRVFVVGHLGDWRRAAAVLLERSGLRRNSRQSRAEGEEVAGPLGAGAPGSGWRDDFERAGAFIPETARSLTAERGHRNNATKQNFIAHTLRGKGFDASEDGTGRGTPIVPFDLAQITSSENRSAPRLWGPCHTLNETSAARSDVAFEIRQDPSASGTVGPLSTGDRFGKGIAASMRVRRLMPVECERLQGFPDGYTAIEGASDSARYEALGNSMAVPVMRWIGQRLQAAASQQPTKGERDP